MTETTSEVSGQKIGRVDVALSTVWEIDAPLADVYRAVVDYRAWQGYNNVTHISGTKGEVGELAIIKKDDADMVPQAKYCRTIKLDPPRQVIWRIYTGPGQVGSDGWEYEYNGTVDYQMEANGPDRTSIRVQVLKEFQVPYENESELAEVQASEDQLQQDVFDHFGPRLQAILGR